MKRYAVIKGSVNKVLGACLAGAWALAAQATDYTWLTSPESSNWLTGVNWSAGGASCAWSAGSNDTATFGASGKTTISIEDGNTVALTNFVVYTSGSDYTFDGGKIQLDGNCEVKAGRTVKVMSALSQPSTSTRFAKEGDGTLVVVGDAAHTNTFNRFAVRDGTMIISGGVHRVTGSTKTANEVLMTASFYGGSAFTLTGGASFIFDGTSTYSANSGCAVLVTDNATLDLWNVGEFLHGFQDHGQTPPSTLTIADGGTVIAQGFRLGKLSNSSTKTNYARTYLKRGGRFILHGFTMDTAADVNVKGTMDFDGGTLVITNKSGESASSTITITSNAAKSWSNTVFNVCAGGAWIEPKAVGAHNYNRPFTREKDTLVDGGLHVTNSHASSLSAFKSTESTYNGGFWLHGGRAVISGDGALGAAPATPTNNIFFLAGATRKNYLAMQGGDVEISTNRQIYIGENVTAEIGTYAGCNGRIRGTIFGEPDSIFKCSDINTGYTYLDPGEGKTNYVGKLNVYGNLVIASGTTIVTSNSLQRAQSDKESLHVYGSGTSFANAKARLIFAGGTLKMKHENYVNVEGYAEAIVTNGHFDCESSFEYLNGLASPAHTFVAENGVLTAPMVRISQQSNRDGVQGDGDPITGVTVATGGVIRTEQIRIDENQTGMRGYFAFDGGTLQAYKINTLSRFGKFLGLPTTEANYDRWTNQQVRVCAGGAIIDTNGQNVQVNAPLWSWAEQDGGLTKRGAGKLTIANIEGLLYPYAGRTDANTYNGVTRVEQGTLVFTRENGGFPGGDIAFTAEGLATGDPQLQMPTLVQNDDKGIRIEHAERLDPSTFGRTKTILALTKTGATISAVPSVTFVATDGTILSTENGWNNWTLVRSSNGKELLFGYRLGLTLLIK